jgi:hypothetical protein
MAAPNAEPLLRFILQMTCIQQLQEMRQLVKHAELSRWILLVRIATQLTLYTGVVDGVITIFTLKGKLNSSYT